MAVNATLKLLIKNEIANDNKDYKKSNLIFYSGQIYDDNFIIDKFPLKYKVEDKLKQIKQLLFFLASTNNIDYVRNNKGIFFTKDTFIKSGINISNPQTMSNWIKGLKNCGIIYTLNNHYQFGHGLDNFSKLYGFNKEGIIKSFKYEYENYIKRNSSNIFNMSKDIKIETDEPTFFYDKNELNHFTKGTIKDFERMLDEYNEGKSNYNKKILHFKCKKNKITGRAYSNYIATEKDDPFNNIITDRTIWCKENNLSFRYDVTSMTSHISYLLKNGIWKNSNYDFYKEISDKSELGLSRDYMKKIYMRLKFGKSAEKSFYDFCYANKNIIRKRYNSKTLYDYYLNCVKPQLLYDWKKLYKIVETIEGNEHSSSVFYFESFLELYVVWKLKKLGITAYNIYDEFFYDKECDIESIIVEGANYMYKKIEEYEHRYMLLK